MRALTSQLVYLHLGASEQKLARIRESVLKLTAAGTRTRCRASCARPSTRWWSRSSTPRRSSCSSSTRPSGRKTYLVSASPEEIVQPLAEYLGVDGAIASRAVVDLDGRYTGEMAFYAYGPFKAEAMRDLAAVRGHRPRGVLRLFATPTPTSPCWRPSATPWPSTPTACWPAWRATVGGRRCSSPGRSGYATAVPVPNLPTAAAR